MAEITDPENTIIMELKDGKVVIELLPDIAPKHTERMKELGPLGEAEGLSQEEIKERLEKALAAVSDQKVRVSFGNASGPVDGVNLGILAQKGSLFVTRPTLFHYYATPEDRAHGMGRVWEMLSSGKVSITIGQTYALKDAAQAHIDLEARKTVGSSVLLP